MDTDRRTPSEKSGTNLQTPLHHSVPQGDLLSTDLTHLQLEEPPLLLHLLCDLGAADLRADHAVLPSVLLLLLLDLGAEEGGETGSQTETDTKTGGERESDRESGGERESGRESDRETGGETES